MLPKKKVIPMRNVCPSDERCRVRPFFSSLLKSRKEMKKDLKVFGEEKEKE